MKSIINIVVAFFLMIGFIACEKAVLGESAANTPSNNFEVFWNDFDQHYGLFQIRGWDWDSIYQAYKPLVTDQTADAELYGYFTEMIEYLDDTHTWVAAPEFDGYTSGSALNDQAEDEFSLDLVKEKYVENYQRVDDIPDELEFSYGKIKDKNVGYIYMNALEEANPDKIDDVVAALKEYEAIIFDIRNNGGGTDSFSKRIAGAFADGRHLSYTVQTRNGSEHGDFDEKKEFYAEPVGDNQYLKPVMILTDRYTVSAAEIFLLHMKEFKQVVQIGDSTSGDFSDTSSDRFLPNGWLYGYSIMQFLLPDGSSLDGIGHVPDVYIKNTEADIEADNDLVMERTFEYLLENYGIQ